MLWRTMEKTDAKLQTKSWKGDEKILLPCILINHVAMPKPDLQKVPVHLH